MTDYHNVLRYVRNKKKRHRFRPFAREVPFTIYSPGNRGMLRKVHVVMMFQPLDSYQPQIMPRTVDEAVERLYDDLLLRDRVVMSKLSEEELDSSVYLVMAKTIRKEFGLYNGNDHLHSSCRSYLGNEYDSYEDPVMVIIKELWKKVRNSHRLHLV